MAKIRNVSGEDRVLPWLFDRLVLADEVVDVPAADPYTSQSGIWEAVGAENAKGDN